MKLSQAKAHAIGRAALTAGLALSMALSGAVPALAEPSTGQTNLYVQV